jgi:hypothetical protein
MNKLLPKIVFYALIVGISIAGTMLYMKMRPASVKNEPWTAGQAPITTNLNSVQPITTCIITVDGLKYDVQQLRSTHTGGDVFKCGTDMSSVFHGKHGESVKRIEKYLVK